VQARENLDLVHSQAPIVHSVGEPVDERSTHVILRDGECVWKAFDDIDTGLHRSAKLVTKASALRLVPRKGLG
jgi:hypothetical protein